MAAIFRAWCVVSSINKWGEGDFSRFWVINIPGAWRGQREEERSFTSPVQTVGEEETDSQPYLPTVVVAGIPGCWNVARRFQVRARGGQVG